MFSGIIRLRRDNDYNYDRIKDVFVPARGEVCLVDTALRGLRAKVGDGKTTYANLEYVDAGLYAAVESVVVRGYYRDGEFYLDSAYTKKAIASPTSIYINVNENNIYAHDGVSYYEVTGQLKNASATTAGVMKLYGETGQHTDGTMTQKAITDELSEKIEIQIDEANETVCFGNW